MTPLEILIAARKLIEKEENWLQGIDAKTADGNMCSATHPAARMFCASGALANVCNYYYHETRKAGRFLNKAAGTPDEGANEIVGCPYIIYNDSHTHAEVLAMFDRAIELAKEST